MVLLWSVVISFLIIDTSLGNLGNLISTSTAAWKLYLFLSIATIFLIGQFFILRFVNEKSLALETRTKPSLRTLYKVVLIVQYMLAGILLIVIFEMVTTRYYSEVMLIASITLSYILGVSMMLLLAQRFFSWFRAKRNAVILVYGLASTMIAIELALTLPIVSALFETVSRTVGGAGLLSETPVYSYPIAYLMTTVNSFYVVFSIASFVATWVATALLLRHYSVKLGKVRYWSIVCLPLLYFLFQFIASILNSYTAFLSISPIFYSILITLVFTLSKPVGGILFGIAFWIIAKNMPSSKPMKDYLIISGFGLLLLFLSDQAFTLIAIPYPPFGLVTISIVGLSCYLVLAGIYSSAVSVARDSELRRSIRELAKQESKLIDSIGAAHMEYEIEKKVTKLVRQNLDDVEKEGGVSPNLSENDMKEYLKEVLNEIEHKKATDEIDH